MPGHHKEILPSRSAANQSVYSIVANIMNKYSYRGNDFLLLHGMSAELYT